MLVAALVCAPGLLMVDYAAHAADNSPYPSQSAVAADYDAHVGEKVDFWAEVERVDGTGFVVTYADHSVRVVGGRAAVEAGDWVQVHGTLRAGNRVEAERVVVSERQNRWYMFSVSVLAVGLAAAAFLRRWTADWPAIALRPRADERRVTDDE